jgi:hypothetical protein
LRPSKHGANLFPLIWINDDRSGEKRTPRRTGTDGFFVSAMQRLGQVRPPSKAAPAGSGILLTTTMPGLREKPPICRAFDDC